MISQTVEHSLRLMVALASRKIQVMTSWELSDVTNVPRPYLSKMMSGLVRAGLVESQRGINGGFRLARPAEDICVWDVMEAIEPVQRIQCCPLKLEGHENACALHRVVNRTIDRMEHSLRDVSLADIAVQCAG